MKTGLLGLNECPNNVVILPYLIQHFKILGKFCFYFYVNLNRGAETNLI